MFILISGICFALAISGRVRRYNAARTVEILRPLIAADARFVRVTVSYGTNGRAYIHGEVDSAEALAALRELVQRTRLPSNPSIGVRVEPSVPNHSWQPAPGRRFFSYPSLAARRGGPVR